MSRVAMFETVTLVLILKPIVSQAHASTIALPVLGSFQQENINL